MIDLWGLPNVPKRNKRKNQRTIIKARQEITMKEIGPNIKTFDYRSQRKIRG